MASLPTGSDKLLEIRTAYIDLIIKCKGKPAVCTWESGAASSSLLVSGIDIEKIGVPAQGIAEKYADHKGIADHKIDVLPLFFEQTVGGKMILPPHGKEFFHSTVSSFLHPAVSTFLHVR